jgi:hypothetical protein
MYIGQWLQNHPHFLEQIYQLAEWTLWKLKPVIARLGYKRVERWLRGPEEWVKKVVFDCRMCGQCILHSTGMTCPMTCPKNLRNGPCGGVRANGHCEVFPEKRCIWVQAYERSLDMPVYGAEILELQPPVNRRLEGSSAWINLLAEKDKQVPAGWAKMPYIPLILKEGGRLED